MTSRPLSDLTAIGAPALPPGYFYRVAHLGHLNGEHRVSVEVRQVTPPRYFWADPGSRRVAASVVDVLKYRPSRPPLGFLAHTTTAVRDAVENAIADAAWRACFVRGQSAQPRRWLRDERIRAWEGEYR